MKYVKIDETNKGVVLELFQKFIDSEGFIIAKDTSRRITCPFTHLPIRADGFSILPGSAIFVNNTSFAFAEQRAATEWVKQ